MNHISQNFGLTISLSEPGVEFISALNSVEPIGYLKRRDECFLIQKNEEVTIKKEQF